MNAGEVFHRLISNLDDSSIDHMLTGAFAASYHGAIRSTPDTDVVIRTTSDQAREFAQQLLAHGYVVDLNAAVGAARERSIFMAFDRQTDWKIDFIIANPSPFEQEAFCRRTAADSHGFRLFVASEEDVIVSHLMWAKSHRHSGQLEDVATLLRRHSAVLDHHYLERWVAELELTSQWNQALRIAGLQQ